MHVFTHVCTIHTHTRNAKLSKWPMYARWVSAVDFWCSSFACVSHKRKGE